MWGDIRQALTGAVLASVAIWMLLLVLFGISRVWYWL